MATRVLPRLKALVFDMDGTLYSNRRLDRLYAQSSIDLIVQRKKVTLSAGKLLFQNKETELQARLGFQPSKLFTLSQLGISDLVWARSTGRIPVANVLKPARRLIATLRELSRHFRLAVVTNNHRENTMATLDVLGVTAFFDEIMTLSESRRFKPAPELYREIAERLAVRPEDCLSVGDRYDLDLAPAAAVGMRILLVEGMQDVYRLPKTIRPKPAGIYPAKTKVEARAAAAAAARALNAGRLAVLPTDTVYGLAAKPEPAAVRWIYRAKGRPEDNPLVLLLSDPDQAKCFAKVPARARELMRRYWPGALTLVLPMKAGTAWGKATRSRRTIALRVPDHDLMRDVIRRCGGALATTSANLSGRPAPKHPGELDPVILAFSEIAVDAGPARVGVPSTVAEVKAGRVRIIRQGSVRLD